MSQERSAQVMRTYLEEAVGKGNFSVIDEFTAEDFVDQSQPDNRGPAALFAHVSGFHETFPDVVVDVQHVIASNDQAVGIWRMKATHANPFIGVPATDKTLEFTITSIFSFRDEMLVDYFVVAGLLEAVMQMGVKLEVAETAAT